MTAPLFFLTGTRLTAEQLGGCLSDVARRLVTGGPLGMTVGPEARLSTSPWTLWPVEVDEAPRRALAAALGEAVGALASATGHEVVGLALDDAQGAARLSRCAPGGEPEGVSGPRERIAATLARWLGMDPVRVAALLGLAEEGEGEGAEEEPAATEEEEFVARKLAEARAWMERYRGGKGS